MSRPRALALLLAILAIALASGVASAAAAPPPGERSPVLPAHVVDATGKQVTVRSAARIVSLNGDISEVIAALGLERNLVGVDISATYPPSLLRTKRSIGYQGQLNAEGIVSLRPTIAIGSTLAGPKGVIDQIRKAGIPTLILPEDDSLAAPVNKIRNVARALGVPRRGRALAARVQAQIRAQSRRAAQAAAGRKRPRVVFLYVRGRNTQLIGGAESRSNVIIRLARGIDAGAELGIRGFRPITPEALVTARPDVLVVPEAGLASVGGIDGLLRIPGVAQTPAGRNRRVIAFDDQLLLGLGPRIGSAIRKLASGLYPGRV